MSSYSRMFIRAFLAGMAIAIGCCVYLKTDPKWVGAVLFSVGLMTVVAFKLDLYTGKVGYAIENPPSYLIGILVIIAGNFVGSLITGLMLPMDQAQALVDGKLLLEHHELFFRAIFCGILMFIAVDFYKQRNSFLAIFFCVPVFILAGFEHSIADMFYFCSAGEFTLDALVFDAIAILGNAVGCMLIPFCRQYMYEPEPAVE